MSDNKVLASKRIVVTRAPEQAHELVHALVGMGAEVLLLPTVGFAPAENGEALDAALRALDTFDAILFTSQNAVRFLVARGRELGMTSEALGSQKCLVAAVGPATAEAAKQEGLRVDCIAKSQSGEALVQELVERLQGSLSGRSVLLPRSDRADKRLPKTLGEAGARVTEVVAYRTLAPEALNPGILNSIRRAEVDTIVFASPSSFHNLCDSIDAGELATLSTRIQFAAIGPTTAQALREAGARVEIEANESSAAGLADSIAKYYQRQPAAANATAKGK
jgi:uroporphyrinogen III methyltransferase/synthase